MDAIIDELADLDLSFSVAKFGCVPIIEAPKPSRIEFAGSLGC